MDGNRNPPPPPPPPPHGSNPKPSSSSSGLPPGNYDIFIIPPHSAGNGFLYLPSLRPQTNSFVAGVVSTLFVVYLWVIVQPTIKSWWIAVSQSGSGLGVAILVLFVGFLGWLSGMTTEKSRSGQGSPHQGPRHSPPPNGYPHGPGTSGGGAHAGSGGGSGSGGQWGSNTRGAGRAGSGPNPSTGGAGHGTRQHTYGQSSNEQTPEPNPRSESSSTAWEKAREETRKREEERRRNEEVKKRQEEDRKVKEETERASRAAAEKEKWEQMRAREKDARERDARERVAKERIAKEAEEKAAKEAKTNAEREQRLNAAKERAEKLRADRAAGAKANGDKAQSEKGPQVFGVGERLDPYSLAPAGAKSVYGGSSPLPKTPSTQKYRQPFAASYDGTATDTAFRPYDTPPRNKPSPSVFSAYSSSYAPSDSTAQTTPPRSHGGPYSTDDPEKIVIRGAYKFTDSFPKPIAIVKPLDSNISDGLIMKIDTDGVFLDDDRKYVPLRQWDIKLWTMKGIESVSKPGFHIIRALVRDPDNTKVVYIVPDAESWKIPDGLKRLKSGGTARSFSMSTMSNSESKKVMNLLEFA